MDIKLECSPSSSVVQLPLVFCKSQQWNELQGHQSKSMLSPDLSIWRTSEAAVETFPPLDWQPLTRSQASIDWSSWRTWTHVCLIELFWEIMNYDLLLSMGSMECVTQADQAAVNGLILWDDRMIKPFRANMLSKDCSYDTWVRSSMMEEARLLASSTALSSVGFETNATCGHRSQDKASAFLITSVQYFLTWQRLFWTNKSKSLKGRDNFHLLD